MYKTAWILGFAAFNLQAGFAKFPAVEYTGSAVNISFEIENSIDVEVAVLDVNGKIVRHLAAGVLGGEFAPPPPLAAGLTQSLSWDLLDDYGKPVTHGPFKIRVRTGVKPVFDYSLVPKVFPANWDYYKGQGYPDTGSSVVDPKETYLSLSHPLFYNNRSLYERYNKLIFAVSDADEEMTVMLKERSFARLARYDGLTGAYKTIYDLNRNGFIQKSLIHCSEFFYTWDGRYLFYHNGSGANNSPLLRYDLNGRPAPYAGDTSYINYYFIASDLHPRGFHPGPDSTVYIVHAASRDAACTTSYEGRCGMLLEPTPGSWGVAKVKEGKLLEVNHIMLQANVGGGVRVDLKGNVYIAARVKPRGQRVPAFVDTNALEGDWEPTDTSRYASQKWWAEEMYGSILKFGPSGGRLVKDPEGQLYAERHGERNWNDGASSATGMEWLHYGYSHVLNHNSGTKASSYGGPCWCSVSRFDVDRFGRIFYPNTFQHEFNALDNNRNLIFRKKNRDIAEVAIGFGQQLEVTDNALYVGDYYNNQVVRFRLEGDTAVLLALPENVYSDNGLERESEISVSAYPNPFNPSTAIAVKINNGEVGFRLVIYDIKGGIVKDYSKTPALHGSPAPLIWDAAGHSSGIYIARLTVGNSTIEKRLVLTK